MGNFEKFVVLVVLLASAAALAVTLNNSETTQGTPSSKDLMPANAGLGAEQVLANQLASRQLNSTQTAKKTATGPKTTFSKLDAGYQVPQKKAVTGLPSESGMPYILVNTEGLKRAHLTKDYMTYASAKGDTWISLAQRFYGNNSYVNALKMANEGVFAPADVDLLMIPLYDFSLEASKRAAFEPAPVLAKEVFRPSGVGTANASAPTTAKTQNVASHPAGGMTYTVKSGDSLSLISYKVYGKASRWREIYAANRDKMKNENSLKLGMQLYVPKSGEYKAADAKGSTGVH